MYLDQDLIIVWFFCIVFVSCISFYFFIIYF